MSSNTTEVFNQLFNELMCTRKSVCVDGDASFQRGFFSGFELAQSVLVALGRKHGVEVNDDQQA